MDGLVGGRRVGGADVAVDRQCVDDVGIDAAEGGVEHGRCELGDQCGVETGGVAGISRRGLDRLAVHDVLNRTGSCEGSSFIRGVTALDVEFTPPAA